MKSASRLGRFRAANPVCRSRTTAGQHRQSRNKGAAALTRRASRLEIGCPHLAGRARADRLLPPPGARPASGVRAHPVRSAPASGRATGPACPRAPSASDRARRTQLPHARTAADSCRAAAARAAVPPAGGGPAVVAGAHGRRPARRRRDQARISGAGAGQRGRRGPRRRGGGGAAGGRGGAVPVGPGVPPQPHPQRALLLCRPCAFRHTFCA